MKRIRRHNTNRLRTGFTLLEVILAVAVTAIVSTALFTSLSGAFTTRKHVEDHLSGKDAARAVVNLIRADLQCVPPAGGRIRGVFIGENAIGRNGEAADSMTYITANPALKSDQDLGDLRQVELRLLESSDDQDYYVLARLVTGNQLAVTTPESTLQVIARRVVSLNLSYRGQNDWVDEYDSSRNDNDLPPVIELTLVTAPELSKTPEDEQELEATYITTHQLIALPASDLEVSENDFSF